MLAALQVRILGGKPPTNSDPKEVLGVLRRVLFDSYNEGTLSTSYDRIYSAVTGKSDKNAYRIAGGIKDFSGRPDSAVLLRDDSAWVHFSLTFKEHDGVPELDSYNFEICFPQGSPRFVRFDLNPPDSETGTRGLRSHCHPGNDDFIVPAPVMSPDELLWLLVNGLRARDPLKPRAGRTP